MKINKILLKMSLARKCKKLNISLYLLDFFIERIHDGLKNTKNKEIEYILESIKKCKDKEDFKSRIIDYYKQNNHLIYIDFLFLGIITGKYEFITIVTGIDENINIDNLRNVKKEFIDKLRENFFSYVLQDNTLKNEFLIDEKERDFTNDLDEDFVLEVFDDVISSKTIKVFDVKSSCKKIAYEYIVNVIGIYKDDILNNFDFILYDINQKTDEDIDTRRKRFLERKSLSFERMSKLDNLDELKNKLKIMNTDRSLALLDRLDKIKGDAIQNIEEIEDVYLEYEILLREDMLDKLFIPVDMYTIIEDFRNIKPQLVHFLFKGAEKHRTALEQELKNKIISERANGNKDLELTEDELKDFEKRKHLLDKQIDFSVVNYFFESGMLIYSDANGFRTYKSDTSNQISTSYFGPFNFLQQLNFGMMGIGFNRQGLNEESIALSSKNYVTTNMGINNLEIYENNDFKELSSNSEEIENHPYKSEIVLFRRNIDSDTKAGYLFVCVSSEEEYEKKSQQILEKAVEISNKNNLKLVIYDIYKIKKSYEEYMSNQNNMEKESGVVKK